MSDNIVRRVNSERAVILGWSRAILLQLAHPLIAAGVGGHSSFSGGVFSAAVRLHHTVRAMLSLIFGDDQRHEEALSRIRAIHRTVRGTLGEDAGPFPKGTPYSAEDPALLLWVHATLVDSSVDIYQRLIRSLTTAELDALCDESAVVLLELGGDPATVPRTWGAHRAYFDTMLRSNHLNVTSQAREIGNAVLAPRAAGFAVPLTGLHTLVTVGLLPTSVRDGYGFAWNERRQTRFDRAIRLLGHARRLTPERLAQWPHARGHR